MKSSTIKKFLPFSFYLLILFVIISSFTLKKGLLRILAGGTPTEYGGSLNSDQVKDFEQNFNWFYKTGEINTTLSTPAIMFDVNNDFLAHIDTSSWTQPGDTGVVFYYALNTENGSTYFTYLMTNAYYNTLLDSIIPIGLFDNSMHSYSSNKYILFHDQGPAASEITGRQSYVSNYVANVSMNQITGAVVKIDTFPQHPHVSFFNTNTIYHFYNDNRSAILLGSAKKIEIKNGAMDKGLLLNGSGISNCKVQVPVLVFKIDGTELLGNEAHLDSPFKNHALDMGDLCPPGHCSCN